MSLPRNQNTHVWKMLEDYQRLPIKEVAHLSHQKESISSFTGISQHKCREHIEEAKQPSQAAILRRYF